MCVCDLSLIQHVIIIQVSDKIRLLQGMFCKITLTKRRKEKNLINHINIKCLLLIDRIISVTHVGNLPCWFNLP